MKSLKSLLVLLISLMLIASVAAATCPEGTTTCVGVVNGQQVQTCCNKAIDGEPENIITAPVDTGKVFTPVVVVKDSDAKESPTQD